MYKRIILFSLLFFVLFNFLYAIAATTKGSNSFFSKIVSLIVGTILLPHGLIHKLFDFKSTGLQILINFALVSVLSSIFIIKLKQQKSS